MFDVLVVGLAGVYVYYLLAHATILDWLLAWPRERWSPLIGCAWCAGFWITGALLVTDYDPVTHLAAATVVGVVGGYVS